MPVPLPLDTAHPVPREQPIPHLRAMRTEKAPVVDGRLDDGSWSRVRPAGGFSQKRPRDGEPASDPTWVRVLYDDEFIYVGVDCPQSVKVVRQLTRRDRPIEADSVLVALDTRGDGKTAFEFGINAAGVLTDGLHFNDTEYSQDWDENWIGKAALTKEGWSAEFRIPLRALRYSERPVQSFGFEVRRYVSARQEVDEWAHISPTTAGEVSHYGRLDDLTGLRARSGVELRPYVLGSLSYYDPLAKRLKRGFGLGLSAGLDLKWHATQEITLDATLLPDFGQVEADPIIMNLTSYEVFYPEKRAFFLEGADAFATPLTLYHTRRIGQPPPAPALLATMPRGEVPVLDPVPSTIYGAQKIVGHVGPRDAIGELVALTGGRAVEAESLSGARVQRVADPLTAFAAFRYKHEVGENAHVGLTLTSVNRVESVRDYPRLPLGAVPAGQSLVQCPLGEQVSPGERCFHDALVASIDGRYRSPSGEYVASGQALASLIEKGPPRTLRDGTVIQSGDIGSALSLRVAKEGGRHVTAEVGYDYFGQKVDYNDFGFMPRQNLQRIHAATGYRDLTPRGNLLETRTTLDFSESDNLAWMNQGRSLALTNITKFKSGWAVGSEVHARPRHFDDREVGDGAALERAGLVGLEFMVSSDARRRLSGSAWVQAHFLENGFGLAFDGQISLRPLPQWSIDLQPSLVFTTGEPRFVAAASGRYFFGHQRAESESLTLRSIFTFSPELYLQLYTQAILESQQYSDYQFFPAVAHAPRIGLSDLRPAPFLPSLVPDVRQGTILGSVMLRWEYRLGSTLYLVYNHTQTTSLVADAARRETSPIGLIRPRVADDALMLKFSYWWE